MTSVPTIATERLRGHAVRHAMSLANANAGLWAIGNGLVSTSLVIYLAADLGATGLAVSFILAAPRFAGLLRLGVPALMARVVARKRLCVASYALSALILCVVPRRPRSSGAWRAAWRSRSWSARGAFIMWPNMPAR